MPKLRCLPRLSALWGECVTLLVAVVPVAVLSAQPTFAELRSNLGLTPATIGGKTRPALGDLNGDGMDDLLFPIASGPSELRRMLATGSGLSSVSTIACPHAIINDAANLWTGIGDMDGDGRPDVTMVASFNAGYLLSPTANGV